MYASLTALGLSFLNMQAVWASAAMAISKKAGFRLVSHLQAANQRVEKVPGVMPNQVASMAKLSKAKVYGSPDLVKWECPLAPDAQEIFTIATPGGLYMPTRVPRGILTQSPTSKRRLHACWRA